MTHSEALSEHIRQVHFGGNWTASSVKDQLTDISLEEALHQYEELNNIATLPFHMCYYLDLLIRVLEGGPLEGKDEESFAHPELTSQQDWENRVKEHLAKAERLASLVQAIPDEKLLEEFVAPKYGSYSRNLHGFVEHTHYHLGQVALIKKLLRAG